MNDHQTMLADMANSLFATCGATTSFATDWRRVSDMGFQSLLLDDASGGFGGGWHDAGIVFRLAGYHALALPLVESVIAARLSADAGFAGAGFGSIGQKSEGALAGGTFTGKVSGVPWGRDAGYVCAPAPDGGTMIVSTDGCTVAAGQNVAGEPRDVLHFTDSQATLIDADVCALGAAARSMQIAGALDAALEMAVGYVNDRQQFGKPLGKLQAVQQTLATFACEAAAANCAAVGVAHALDRGDASFEVAAAKIRTNMAAGIGTSIAHQAHGAIGFTMDYGLQALTRRLWSWRSEFGGENHWSLVLGQSVVSTGADAFWPALVRRSDPVMTVPKL
jgi:acyl-CoA dehydrogenase